AQFRAEILPSGQPAVMRGVARDWPLVTAARADAHRCMALLSARASDALADVLRAEPQEDGRFHYSADGKSLNFVRGQGNLPGLLAGLRDEESADRPCAMVAQGLIAERFVPGFSATHPMPFVPASAEPRLWIGNAAKVATHNDPIDNVGVVAAGRRRFTLFPPEAEANLYMGPAHPTPAGTPVSMVHVTAPDLDRYPRFADALESAQQAELAPGDAIFIPRDWFHHVEALERFNVLVNYWWDSSKE
ncbi:MAG TPA: cupin-like domain-containing protein, partial [Sphingomicrobium sp.]